MAPNVAGKVVGVRSTNVGREHRSKVKLQSRRLGSGVDNTDQSKRDRSLKAESSLALDHYLGTYGSMRKEKKWRRTLACKLLEERHSVDGDEGMDLLWEMYERDSNGWNKKKEDESDEEEEEKMDHGQLCCLYAIKCSAGKINLGLGRPTLVRISKAIKGFGWWDHVRKYGKKVHNKWK